ncbi:mycofactocin-coupled SDR family oxidoreductase [Amycolatopsis pigmentata]|uniref:Mycofactocin-coupled SDR family oxidoreductase n=1 Tax=Amycolatopsis pigmentata TaxID=450801 RepID=A0ABW5FQ99_9PSEU
MPGKLDGKVVLITGAARGQGRSHALRLAEEGADILAIDIAAQVDSVQAPMATPEDLALTVLGVEALGQRVAAYQADVRDYDGLNSAVGQGVDELGRLDIVLANAGIGIAPSPVDERMDRRAFDDLIAINLCGVRNTLQAAVPQMIQQGDGGAIVLTSSTQGLSGRGGNGTGAMDGYVAAKHGVVGLMRSYANWLAPHSIRVNSIHPTGVNTPMIMNDAFGAFAEQSPTFGSAMSNLLPVGVIEASDVSNAVAFLVSNDARFITGVALPVDAGFMVK